MKKEIKHIPIDVCCSSKDIIYLNNRYLNTRMNEFIYYNPTYKRLEISHVFKVAARIQHQKLCMFEDCEFGDLEQGDYFRHCEKDENWMCENKDSCLGIRIIVKKDNNHIYYNYINAWGFITFAKIHWSDFTDFKYQQVVVKDDYVL